jgi:hypothetical protein
MSRCTIKDAVRVVLDTLCVCDVNRYWQSVAEFLETVQCPSSSKYVYDVDMVDIVAIFDTGRQRHFYPRI